MSIWQMSPMLPLMTQRTAQSSLRAAGLLGAGHSRSSLPLKKMVFFSYTWRSLGTKEELVSLLSSITRIGQKYLLTWIDVWVAGKGDPCIAQVMSWAAERKTTRIEDRAYCLLGLFDIHMPLLYGEGRKSFFRLQEELLKCSPDQSLLAWGVEPPLPKWDPSKSWRVDTNALPTSGRFARGPEDFCNSGNIRRSYTFFPLAHLLSTPAMVHRGFHSEMPTMQIRHVTVTSKIQYSGAQIMERIVSTGPGYLSFAIVLCCFEGDKSHLIGIPILRLDLRDSPQAAYPQ
jgi:hypothetical protein